MPESDEDEGGQEVVARSFWSGTITFGLVSVPVALYAANRSQRVSMRMVSPEGTPLTRRYFTSKDDRELDADEIVRGYEVEKGRFVIADDDELERLAPERTRDIDLRQFVDASEIDPMYFERAYYLTPNGQSTKAYRLLARVMEETGRAGIATFVMRTREYLVAILAENGILRAETLRFADELRTPGDIGLPEPPAKPDAAELKRMDREIGKQLETRLDTKELEDHSADRLLKVVRQKVRAGEDVVQLDESEQERSSDVIDLMEILKRRLQGHTEEEDAPAASPPAPRRQAEAEGGEQEAADGREQVGKEVVEQIIEQDEQGLVRQEACEVRGWRGQGRGPAREQQGRPAEARGEAGHPRPQRDEQARAGESHPPHRLSVKRRPHAETRRHGGEPLPRLRVFRMRIFRAASHPTRHAPHTLFAHRTRQSAQAPAKADFVWSLQRIILLANLIR